MPFVTEKQRKWFFANIDLWLQRTKSGAKRIWKEELPKVDRWFEGPKKKEKTNENDLEEFAPYIVLNPLSAVIRLYYELLRWADYHGQMMLINDPRLSFKEKAKLVRKEYLWILREVETQGLRNVGGGSLRSMV